MTHSIIPLNKIAAITKELANGQKISGIRLIREVSNLGLKEAKDVADTACPLAVAGYDRIQSDLIQELTQRGFTVEGFTVGAVNGPIEFEGATWVDPTPALLQRIQVDLLTKILAQLLENNEIMKDLMEELS